jgi:class I lanthipeptide synthase
MTTPTIPGSQVTGQSLASGAAGTALLHIELALTGAGSWRDAAVTIELATREPIDASPSGCLLHGAPALALVLDAARADGQPRYQSAVEVLDRHVQNLARQRLIQAQARLSSGNPGTFDEHDLFYGLTGIGVVLLRVVPESDVLADILAYLIRIATQPLTIDGLQVPGWWSDRDPDPLSPTPGGHANMGVAHGAAGLLAFLSISARTGHVVDGQFEAIGNLCAWFDQWEQQSDHGPLWPQWITRAELRTGRTSQPGPGRPSWCYGTPGIARALQLAAIATGDLARQIAAEHALAATLAGPRIARLTNAGLCHGVAGVYQTAARANADAVTPAIADRLPEVAAAIGERLNLVAAEPNGLITGNAGVRLALETARRSALPISGWDTCLLLA